MTRTASYAAQGDTNENQIIVLLTTQILGFIYYYSKSLVYADTKYFPLLVSAYEHM